MAGRGFEMHDVKLILRQKSGSPPFSPDLAPCNFFLFPRMKRDLKRKRFQNIEEVREKKDGSTEGYHFARIPELF